MTKQYFRDGISLDPVCRAALNCFMENGFHGTSIRQIASAAGLSVPGIYHHYASKSALLETLCDTAMQTLLAELTDAVSETENTLDEFEQVISCLLQFHAKFGDIAFVTYSEIRSFAPAPRERHLQDRRNVQGYVTRAVERAVAENIFSTPHPRHASRAITNICLGVAQWYQPGRSMGIDELVAVFTDICKDTVRVGRS